MRLELQSVEKVPFSTFAWAFAPKMLDIGLARLRMSRRVLHDLSRAVSLFSRDTVAGNHRQLLSIQLSHKRLQSSIGSNNTFFSIRSGNVIVLEPVGSKKGWRWFLATGHLDKRKTALDRSRRKLRLIRRRGRRISNTFGSKAHANVHKCFLRRTANPTS